MTHYLLPSETGYNFSSGGDQILLYIQSQVSNLTNYILAFIYLIILLGGYMGTKRLEGRNDFALWMIVSGMITFVITLYMNLIQNETLVPTAIEVIYFSLAIVGAFLYFITPER